MNLRATNLECSLCCPWTNTRQCLRHLVKESVVLRGRLGSSQLSGVRSIYYPHDFPPCVKADGSLQWDHLEHSHEPALLLWEEECPAL